ncbi:MAG: LysR substrate-binding domain-containing protein, partial [Motiliproteus sp.]
MQSRLPLNNLNTFASAAECLSFQGAAEVLYVTPSAVSHQIRNLEAILGYKLFERLDKGVRLTPQGERLYIDIREPLRRLHEASRKAVRGREDNSLALSVAPAFATQWLLPRLRDFYSSYSEINLSVIATTDLVDFSVDPFDASIRMGKGGWPKTSTERLFPMQLVAVCHPNRLAANNELFSVAQVKEQALIQNSSMTGLWEQWFQSAGIAISGKLGGLQVQNSAQVVEAIQSSDAFGLVEQRFIRQDLESGRLVIACDHVLTGEDGYFLTYPESAAELPALQRFRDWLFTQVE